MMTSSKFLFGMNLYFICLTLTAGLQIIPKKDWKGQDADSDIDDLKLPVNNIIVSHTASESCADRSSCDQKLRNIQKLQMDVMGFSDIAYNFLIGNDGSAYEGRGWNKVGAHTKGHNAGSIGISFVGTFNTETPNDAALSIAQELIAEGVRTGKVSNDYKLFGHRQFSATDSPGDSLYSVIKKWPHWSKRD